MKTNKNKLSDKKITAVIRISNLTVPQSIALEDMLATWQQLGSMGASRWTSFFVDGDGNFRPTILYNGYEPQKTDLLEKEEVWRGSEYKIDFDCISWKLHSNEDIRIDVIKKAGKIRILIGTLRFLFKQCIKDIRYIIKLYKLRMSRKKCPVTEASYEEDRPCDKG